VAAQATNLVHAYWAEKVGGRACPIGSVASLDGPDRFKAMCLLFIFGCFLRDD